MTILAYFRHSTNWESVSIVTEAPEEGTPGEMQEFWLEEYGETPYEVISWPTDRLLECPR